MWPKLCPLFSPISLSYSNVYNKTSLHCSFISFAHHHHTRLCFIQIILLKKEIDQNKNEKKAYGWVHSKLQIWLNIYPIILIWTFKLPTIRTKGAIAPHTPNKKPWCQTVSNNNPGTQLLYETFSNSPNVVKKNKCSIYSLKLRKWYIIATSPNQYAKFYLILLLF